MKRTFTWVAVLGLGCGGALWSATASAGECVSGKCGNPAQSGGGPGGGGGGGGGGGAGAPLVALTDRGDLYQFADDQDGDGIEDEFDNCAFRSNYDQSDLDGDYVGDSCDNCPSDLNQDQRDMNGDKVGDLCDTDRDGDSIPNEIDNCAGIPNLAQTNTDGDLVGDMCDEDDDNDGAPDLTDSCRLLAVGSGPDCDDDPDGDGVVTSVDNCPSITNPMSVDGLQPDMDGNGVGDACDLDRDGDGFENWRDNCVGTFNPTQTDYDNDGVGDDGTFEGVGASCDTAECYVVDRDNPGDCLDPNSAFQIKLALAGVRLDGSRIRTGDLVNVRIFTNRLDTLHQWSARFNRLPDESDVSLINARGSASTYAGTFQIGDDPETSTLRFTPDQPGRYVLDVTATLPEGDTLGASSSTMSIAVEVEGEPQGGGCAATGTRGDLALLVLGLGAITALRRRRA